MSGHAVRTFESPNRDDILCLRHDGGISGKITGGKRDGLGNFEAFVLLVWE